MTAYTDKVRQLVIQGFDSVIKNRRETKARDSNHTDSSVFDTDKEGLQNTQYGKKLVSNTERWTLIRIL